MSHITSQAYFRALAILFSISSIWLQGCSADTQIPQQTRPKTLAEAPSERLTENDLNKFTSWLVGRWDNIAQVQAEIDSGVAESDRRHRYAMQYTAIQAPSIQGRLLAIENYDDGRGFEGDMQRVSLHRFMLSEDSHFILHEILFLKDEAFRKSLAVSLKPLEMITEDDIRARESCRLYWKWTGKRFEGATQQGACVTNSYMDRNITVEGLGVLEPNRLMRHDRNFEMSGEEIPHPGHETADKFIRVSD